MITFVILHYNGLADTIKGVDSILSCLNNETISIIIVDNQSKDKEGLSLLDKYSNLNNIKVILNKNNSGFSKGNNIGCKYAMETFNPDFICVFNNDVYIDNKDFIKDIYSTYSKVDFDVMGPVIWNTQRNYNQNPIQVSSTLEEVQETLERILKGETLLNSRIPLMYYFYNRLIKQKLRKDLGLHGAALIFSKKYYERYDKIFPELTFMYGEEDFLYYRKLVDNLVFHYEPDLKVYHNHSASTKSLNKSIVNKWIFQNKYMKIAFMELRDVYKFNKKI